MKSNKAGVTLECEECEEVTFEVDNCDSSLDVGEGAIRFMIVFMFFLGVEGWTS